MNFILSWIVYYLFVMFAMCTDNIFWITASPEWPKVKQYPTSSLMNYVWKDRILAVLKNKRDIIPGIITSFLMAVMLR